MIDIISNIEKEGDIYYPINSLEKKINYPDSGYDNLVNIEENSFWFQYRNKCIVSLVESFAPNEILVDIGGGNGFTSYILKKHGLKSILIEPGQAGAFNASKRGVETVCGTIEELNFNSSKIKSVGLFDVIEHIEDDLGFLKQIYKISSPEVMIFATVPAYNFLWSDEDIYAGHIKRYNLKSLSKLFIDAGFKIEYSSYYFQILILPILFFRALPFKLGIKKKQTKENLAKDHHKKGFLQKFIENMLNIEYSKIKQHLKLNYGASLILVAKK